MKLRILPGSLWLAYGIVNKEYVQSCLPERLALAPLRIFRGDDAEEPKLLFNCYDVDASPWMKGHRVEIQTLAVDRETLHPHLVILDVLSDTMMWDPCHGVRKGNALVARDPVAPPRDLSLRIVDRRRGRPLLSVQGQTGRKRDPDRRFVVDANRACYFGTHPIAYPMEFDEKSVRSPVRTLNRLRIDNRLWEDVRRTLPTHAFYHEQPMDFSVHVPELWYDR